MNDQDLRDFLDRMATEEPAPFFDAAPLTRRARRRAARTMVVGAFAITAAIAVLFASASQLREASPTVPAINPTPAPEVSGALVYSLGGDIYVADPDGSNAVKIADGTNDSACQGVNEYSIPSWSPDGKYLAFQYDCSSSKQTGVTITDPQGNVLAVVSSDGQGFSWSPDSSRVAVWRTWPEKIDVYGVDGGRHSSVSLGPDVKVHSDGSPGWMPDGSALLLYGTYVVALDGSSSSKLPLSGLATYSPNGTRVAVVDGNSITVLDAADGSTVSQVDTPLNEVDGWSPGGERFASLFHGELYVVDVASGTAKMLPEARAALGDGDMILGVRGFSSQGDRILYETGDGAGGGTALWSIAVGGSDARLVVAGTTQGEWLSR
jgi:Tol biopolymer transport system component